MNIAIIGYGYWGPNLVRNFAAQAGCTVSAVVDQRPERLEKARQQWPGIHTTTDAHAVLSDPGIDAVAIATPVFTHYQLAKTALENGKHVVLEKPMTRTVAEAEALGKLAQEKGLVLMVDHTFLYTGAVQRLKKMVSQNELGQITYFDSTRINLGLFQPDVNVLWDLAPHDLSILGHLIDEKPHSVQATGAAHTSSGLENIAYLTINFPSGLIAHFNVSWVSPVKIRMMLIGGDKKMAVFNDMEPSEKIKVYDTGYDVRTDEEKARLLVDYRAGDIYVPKLATTEALGLMARDFVNAITTGSQPVSDWQSGLSVVRILEASDRSLAQRGAEVLL